MKRFSWWMVSLTVLCGVVSTRANAQENPRADVAPIYEEGLRAKGAKDYATAIQKFTEVTQKYPEGIGAWLELGHCEQLQGRLARAYEVYLAARAAANGLGQAERAKRAEDAAKALEGRLSRWVIAVPGHTRGLSKLVVRVDGSVWNADKWDKPWPVDGGTHEIVVMADGKKPWKTTVEIKIEGDSKTVNLGPLADEVLTKPLPLRPAAVVMNERAKPVKPLRVAGFVTGGVGLAALVGGSIAGGLAISRHGAAVDGGYCLNGGCNEVGAKLEAESRLAGNVSTGLFIAGGVLVGAGVVMAFALPTKEKASANVLVGPTGAMVRWVF